MLFIASANMSVGASPSDQPPKKWKEYWELSQEFEHAEEAVPRGDEEYEAEIESESDEDSPEEDKEEEGTEGERNTGEDDAGGSHIDGSHSRKRNRKPTNIGTMRQEFTAVTSIGIPREPKCHSEGYGRQIVAILWNTVPMTTINLRSQDNIHYCQLLIDKMHTRYKFPDPYNNTNLKGNKVNKWALRKMSKALSSWKTRVKTTILEKNIT